MKRILINVNSIVRYSGATHLSGIGRSTYSLISGFAKIKCLPFKILLYNQRVKSGGLEVYNYPFDQVRVPLPNKPVYTKLANSFRIKEVLTNYDLYHIPHNTDYVTQPGKTLFTIHDLMIYRFPEYFPVSSEFKAWAQKLVKESKAIVTCSECSKNDISYYWGVYPEKISVIPWGIDRHVFSPSNEQEIETIKEELNLRRPYFLSVSNSHPRKNLRLVLNGFREFTKSNPEVCLVIIWGNPTREILNEYRNEVLNNKIIFINHVTDPKLRQLYSGAVATLFPSLYEGFGFPVLESLACHTPVITCSNSSLKDLGANLAIYTSENDVNEFVEHLSDVYQCRQRFINEPEIEKHLARFNWTLTAQNYIDLYNSLIN